MLDEDEKQDKLVSSTKNRKCWIFFDKFSQHWEVECQDMPEAEFYHRFRNTRQGVSKFSNFMTAPYTWSKDAPSTYLLQILQLQSILFMFSTPTGHASDYM